MGSMGARHTSFTSCPSPVVATLPPGKGKQTTSSRNGKRKQTDQLSGTARFQAEHNTQHLANQAAREILFKQEQARIHLRGLQDEARALEQARDLALAHTHKATQPPPGPTCATPEGAEHVNTFLKEAQATALQVQILLDSIKRTISNYYSLQGNEDLRQMQAVFFPGDIVHRKY